MLLPTFASMEEVPEAFRPSYEMVDGKAVPSDIAKLTAALNKERAEREVAAKAAKDAEKRAAELEQTSKAQKAGLTDAQLAELRADFEKQVAPEREARAAAEQKLRALQLDAALKSVMATSGVRAERIDTMWKLVGDQFDLNADGSPIVKANPTAQVKDHVAGLVKEYPEFFAAPAASGGGADRSAALPSTTREQHAALAVADPAKLIEIGNAQGRKAA
jgi:multidrug efflux pump subunit AcrA (membrane-fusion protein)